MSSVIDKLITDLALKYNLKESEIDKIVNSQFKFLMMEMQTGLLNTVKLPHFGKFYVSNKKKAYWTEKRLNDKRAKDS